MLKAALRLDEVSVQDNFFDLGADSLILISVHRQLERELKREILVSDFFQFPTIRGVTERLNPEYDETSPNYHPPLMTCLRAGTRKSPFFFAHGDYYFGGPYCRKIVQQLDADQPFYALSPQGTFGGEFPPDYATIAARYLEMIRSVQPHGPYQLGGFCNGALAIYEVAQQLVRAGETVRAIILLDPPDLHLFLLRRRISGLGKFIGLPESQCRWAYQRIAEGVEIWYYYGARRFVTEFAIRFYQWTRKNLGRVMDSRHNAGVPPKPNVAFHYYELIADYEPQPYLGTTSADIILRQEEIHRNTRQIKYWRGFLPEARFELLLGSHLDLKSNVEDIARTIKVALSARHG